jgi:EAL domain-containing protein (putative c-di-GMP-specific phosphodiesterase class I)
VGRHTTAEALLGDADLAMYEAKANGGGGYVVFEPGMRARVVERARICAALERACTGEGLALEVQPIVTLTDGAWVGFEALARWQDGPRQRLPREFLPLAEETGLIVRIGAWVLREALTWLSGWPDPATGISVNVAGRQVATPGFADLVRGELTRSGVKAHRLTLEITEQTAVEDLERAGAVLQPLRSLGVHVALDDFGTGFSSLGYLARLPVDELKIDRRFVSGVGVRSEDDALVRAVIGLADDLGLRVVAEGVETSDQARTLLEQGCVLAQGYRFRPPMPIHAVPRFPLQQRLEQRVEQRLDQRADPGRGPGGTGVTTPATPISRSWRAGAPETA